jgi:hypothetical protein
MLTPKNNEGDALSQISKDKVSNHSKVHINDFAIALKSSLPKHYG